MITPELVSYIENQLKNGKKKEDIISRLVYAGWYREDINEGFNRVSTSIKPFDDNLEKTEITKKVEEVKEEFIPNLMSKNPIPSYLPISEISTKEIVKEPLKNDIVNIEPVKIEPKKDEDNLETKTSAPLLDFDLLSKLESTLSNKQPEDLNKNKQENNFPKDAIISTFSKDFNRASVPTQKIVIRKNKKSMKWSIRILFILLLIFGVYFVISKEYIKFDNFNFKNIPILGGDPNKILIDGFKKINGSQFYKNESDVIFKSSGNLKMDFLSTDLSILNLPDEINIHTLSIYDKVSPDLISFDNLSTIESPSWVNKGVINLKHNGSTFFIPTEALSKIIEFTDLNGNFIEISDSLINNFFSDNILTNNVSNNLNIENILVNGIHNIIFEKINSISNTNTFSLIEKDSDFIKDVEVRYFEIIPSDPYLAGLLDNFIKGSQVESFEFWVDKDVNIFKYKIIVNIPSSYISSSSSEKIKIEISSLFYDINGENTISIPEDSVKIDEFLTNIKDIKDRNQISSFKAFADQFYNISNSYGKKPNSSGSCSSALDGSLFSSLGHGENLQSVVGEIKNKIDELNIYFGNNISCYSTAGTWAISVPLSTDPSLYWCTDNAGETIKTTNKLSFAVCQ